MKRRQFINSIGAGAGLTALGLSAGCATVGGAERIRRRRRQWL